MLIVPTSTELSSYTQRTEMDGTDYVLRFQFSQRLGRWYVSIFDQDDVPIAQGLGIRSNFEVARFLPDEIHPPGQLLVLDTVAATDQEAVDPGLRDLGDRVLLAYFEEAELLA